MDILVVGIVVAILLTYIYMNKNLYDKCKKKDPKVAQSISANLVGGVFAGLIGLFIIKVLFEPPQNAADEWERLLSFLMNPLAFVVFFLFLVAALIYAFNELWKIHHPTEERKPVQEEIKKNKTIFPDLKLNYNFFLKKGWFLIAAILFVLLWWNFLNFFPLINAGENATLPTHEVRVIFADGGSVGVRCLSGEVFKERLVQDDILDCRLRILQNSEMVNGVLASGFNLSIITRVVAGDEITGEEIPTSESADYSEWNNIEFKRSDFQNVEAKFHIKVPPTKGFTFALDMPGYYISFPPYEAWYPSTKLDEYIRSTLPQIQLLVLFFGVFGAVKYARDLWVGQQGD